MKSSKKSTIFSILGLLSAVTLMIVSIGDIFLNVEKNGCVMTWMYNTPRYIPISLSDKVKRIFPKYGLFIYGEDRYASHLDYMGENLQLTGIPVLFVHGNAGRYKQVRSPGSVSLSKSERKPYTFNYFTVDYEEELSALHGPFLEKQTEFLFHSIERIFDCYTDVKSKPTSVITIGHSMGGMVIRGLLALPYFDASKISTVITLATPQTEPVLRFDRYISDYYDKVNQIWKDQWQKKFRNITFLSLGGSFRDHLVRSDLCLLDKLFDDFIYDDQADFSSITTSLPRIWLSNDHQCIVWCNQLVRALTRFFFNMIDPSTKQITTDYKLRRKILLQTLFFEPLEYKILASKEQSKCKDLSFENVKVIEKRGCYKIRSSDNSVKIWARTERFHTVYQCNADDICSSISGFQQLPGSSISQLMEVKNKERATYIIDVKGEEKVYLMRSASEKLNILPLPFLSEISHIFSVHRSFHFTVLLTQFTSPWQAYDISITPKQSEKFFSNEIVILLRNPGRLSDESNVFWFKPNEPVRFQLKMFTVSSLPLELDLFSTAEISSFHITVTPNLESLLGQLMRFNVEDCLKYALVLHVACYKFGENFKYFLYLAITAKILVYLINPVFWSVAYFIDIVLPQTYLLMVSFTLCKLFSLIMSVLFILLRVLFVPCRKLINSLVPFKGKSWQMSIALMFLIAVLSYLYVKLGIVFVLQVVLLLNVVHINMIDCKESREKRWQEFICFLPINLIFTVVPTIVSVKDRMQGYPHQVISYPNLDILTIVNLIHFVLCVHSKRFDISSKSTKLMSIYGPVTVCFLFKKFVRFYNITYLVVVCLLLDFCQFIASIRLKEE